MSVSRRVYLDWNATTPLRPQARAAMLEAWDSVGNPSSIHEEGRAARAIMERARAQVAAAVGSEPRSVVFTSGGTEANVLALSPHLRASAGPVERLLVSAVEHPSVLAGGQFSPERIERIAVDAAGRVDLDDLAARLANGPPALVSVMVANNETGALQPIREAVDVVREHGALLHADAVQGIGKIEFNISGLNVDLATVSSHKVGGPKGLGALVLGPRAAALPALVRGGGQERGRRAGTENVAGIAGFGAAIEAAVAARPDIAAGMMERRNRFEAGLKRVSPDLVVFSEGVARLPNTTLFAIPGYKAEMAVIAFDLAGVAVSSGSACSSGKVQPSHVVTAMGYPAELAGGAIRASLGWDTTAEDVDFAIEAWRKLRGALGKGTARNSA